MILLSSIPGVELVAEPPALAGLGATLLFVLPFVVLVWVGLYLWTGFAGARLFARTGGEPWKAWVPFVNEAEVFARGGKPAYSLIYCFIPVVAIYGLVVRIAAVYRINRRFGLGAGATALGIVLPPVWMSVLAWGPEPLPEAVANEAADDDEADDPATMFAPRDASGYAIPVAAPAPALALVPAPAPAPAPVLVEAPAPPPSEAPRVLWRIETTDGQGFDLAAPSVVLGRNPVVPTPDVQRIALPDATRTLSKTHARLDFSDGAWQLTDLDSTNGVRVVDAAGALVRLERGGTRPAGERFRLGDVELRLAYDLVAPAPQAAVPSKM